MAPDAHEVSEVERMARPWVVVGAGRLGTALGLAARRRGIEVAATWNRTESGARRAREALEPAQATSGPLPEALQGVDLSGVVVWLTVVDDALLEVAEVMAGRLQEAALVLHACGSLEAEALREVGIDSPVGGIHPLLAVTDPEQAAERLEACVWTVDGDREVVAFAEKWTDLLGARLFEIEAGARAGYHASAATAANLVVALFDAALEMAGRAGLDREEAREMLLPLLRSSVDNLADQPTVEALSGPAARGDTATIERHRRRLAEADSDLLKLYDLLTDRALALGGDRET